MSFPFFDLFNFFILVFWILRIFIYPDIYDVEHQEGPNKSHAHKDFLITGSLSQSVLHNHNLVAVPVADEIFL